jgi:hypothetical protein
MTWRLEKEGGKGNLGFGEATEDEKKRARALYRFVAGVDVS